jgi:hypothetical protein
MTMPEEIICPLLIGTGRLDMEKRLLDGTMLLKVDTVGNEGPLLS